ncbi:MAG: hypothetical protein CL398_00590 [Acidiferrobacteraceae bacterium]|nr:hypothetical protein [Acidiferrobacteraceae bacterium]
MFKWARRFVSYSIGLILVLALCVFMYISFWFELADHRDQVSRWATQRLQSQVIFSGDMELKLKLFEGWPSITLSFHDVALKEDPAIGTENLFGANQLIAHFALHRLFIGHLSPKIVLDTPYVRLMRINNETTNWDSLSSAIRPDGAPLTETDLGVGLLLLADSGLTIANGSIEWKNNNTQIARRLSAIELSTSSVGNDGRAYFFADFDFGSNLSLERFRMQASASVSRRSSFGPIMFKAVDLELLAPRILISLQASEVEVREEWEGFDVDGLRVSGAVDDREFQIVSDRMLYTTSVESVVMTNTTVAWLMPLLDLRANFDSIELSDALKQLEKHRHFAKYDAIGDILWSLARSGKLGVNGDIAFHVTDPYQLFDSLEVSPDMSFPKIKGALSGSAIFSVTDSITEIEAFQLNWEESSLSAALTDAASGAYEFSFDLIEQDVELISSPEGAVILSRGFGVVALGELLYRWRPQGRGNIRISRVRWNGVELRNIHIPLYSRNMQIGAKEAKFDLYGGRATIDVFIDHSSDGITIHSSQIYHDVSLLPMLRNFGFAEILDAQDLSLDIHLFHPLDQFALARVNGTVRLAIPNGRLRKLGGIEFLGKPIREYIYDGRRLLGIENSGQGGDDAIDFRDGELVLGLEDGQVVIENASFNASGITVKAKGRYLPGAATFDTLWYLDWADSVKAARPIITDQVDNIAIPLRVKGDHNNVTVSLDMVEFIRLLSNAP